MKKKQSDRRDVENVNKWIAWRQMKTNEKQENEKLGWIKNVLRTMYNLSQNNTNEPN